MASDEHTARTDVECHRCNAISEAEVDISEELAAARREALEEAAKVVGSARGPLWAMPGLAGKVANDIRALAAASDGEPGGG